MSHATHKGRREFDVKSALHTVRQRCPKAQIKTVEIANKELRVLEVPSGVPGNGTLGALDYLAKKHKVVVLFV